MLKYSFTIILVLLIQGILSGQNYDITVKSKITEPYPFVSGNFTGDAVSESPDPLSGFRWNKTSPDDNLEIYVLHPISISSDVPQNMQRGNRSGLPLKVNGTCDIVFDFGRESAGWLEFDSDDLDGEVEMSISEYNEPAILNAGAHHPQKTLVPVKHGSTYRLELNDELYEGVRFGWIHLKKLSNPCTIKDVRLVCQVKPTNYSGSFSSSNPALTRMWYTGAYTDRKSTRLNSSH